MMPHGKDDEHMPHAGDAAVPSADAGEADSHLGQGDADDVKRDEPARPTARHSGGLRTSPQPNGTVPGVKKTGI